MRLDLSSLLLASPYSPHFGVAPRSIILRGLGMIVAARPEMADRSVLQTETAMVI